MFYDPRSASAPGAVMFNDPTASAMPGMAGAGFGNMLAPAMEANDEALRRRQRMAALLMQHAPQPQPMQPMMQPTVDQDGVSMGRGGNPFASIDTKAIGEALGKWFGSSTPNTTGMGVQMGGLY